MKRLAALTAALTLTGCAATTLRITLEENSTAVLKLEDGAELKLTGPAELHFRCRTWGDSYFQVLDWTCSGGQLSEQGAQFGGIVAKAIVEAALAATGVGAAGAGASLAGEALRGALEDAPGEAIEADPAPADLPMPEVTP